MFYKMFQSVPRTNGTPYLMTCLDLLAIAEQFQQCFDDYNTGLSLLETLVEADDRRIAELCFKFSLAKQLSGDPREALDYCKRAIAVSERRLARLSRELPKEQTAGKGLVDTGKRPVGNVDDGSDAAQENDHKPSLESKAAESVVVGGKGQEEGPEAVKAEVKEIDELLVDLREKVSILLDLDSLLHIFNVLIFLSTLLHFRPDFQSMNRPRSFKKWLMLPL
jgi:hypothetical protein